MSTSSPTDSRSRAHVHPLPENIRSVQPGGGKCYQIEMAWGRVRRRWLRRFRPGYVRRMAALRTGSTEGAPHEILDPRDLKFCRNLCTASWPAEHDRFRWRERLPLARWGLAEVQLMGWPLLAVTVGLSVPGFPWNLGALASGICLALVVYFFRDPRRTIPSEAGAIVAPADGKLVEITPIEHDQFIGGPAVRLGIFLSIFNVHINRAPERCRVVRLHYSPGMFLNAMNPESAIRNEFMWIGLEQESAPYRRFAVRQISGLIARRIVCAARPGEVLERGEKFGMIKLGSRTELVVPDDGLELNVRLGQKMVAGTTIVGRYAPDERRPNRDANVAAQGNLPR